MLKANSLLLYLLLIGLGLLTLGNWSTTIPAPDVTFTTIEGKKIELSKLKGKPVIVTFWATDCAGCIEEIPHLVEIYNQFHPQGLEIIAVAMYYDPPNHVVDITQAKQIPYDVALDLKAEHAFAFGQVELIPNTFLISPAGEIIMQHTGVLDISNMKQQIEQLITG